MHGLRLAGLVGVAIAALAGGAAPALALPRDPDAKPGAGGPSRLEQAREESGQEEHPPARHPFDAGVLRLSPSELLASAREELELSVKLERAVVRGTLEVTLPSAWTGRAGASGLPYAHVPTSGRGSSGRARVQRAERVV
jgi:hypothetical protein